MKKYSTLGSPKSKISGLARANLPLALLILSVDIVIYVGAVAIILLSDDLLIKAACAGLAGFMISQLFVIAHDAAHQAYVPNKKLNAFIARLCFLPSLHNYSLWLYIHNQIHHGYPNVKNLNSWSPKSWDEYSAMPRWRQAVERIYRSPLGFGPYYIVERWFKEKIYPKKHIPKNYHQRAWKDVALLAVYFVGFASIISATAYFHHTSIVSGLFWAFLVPFIVWNYAVGMTIYLHHTHQTIKWYESLSEWKSSVHSAEEIATHVKYPFWYNLITHNIYLHPIHHFNPRVPLYRLKQAQKILTEGSNNKMHIYQFRARDMLRTLSDCKLYNYARHEWLDFNGDLTSRLEENKTFEIREAG